MSSIEIDYKEGEELYQILELSKGCTAEEIKKAYYKKALKYHPDKQVNLKESEKQEIVEKFQNLQKAYDILSDENKRKNYDMGVPIESLDLPNKTFEEWSDYFKEAFSGKVTIKAIEELKKEYVNSEEEKQDVLKYYNLYSGDMDKIMESIMFSSVKDENRFTDIIIEGVENKKSSAYKTFKKTTSNKYKEKRKRQEIEENKLAEKEENNNLEQLALAIQSNQNERSQNFDTFFDDLEKKYATKPKNKKRKEEEAPKEKKKAKINKKKP